VATLGTACTPDHTRKLFRSSDKVVFAFDGDSAGRRAARKALEATLGLMTDTRSAKFLFLPTEHDPDSYIRENGPVAFEQMVQSAVPLSRFLLDCAADQADLDTTEGRALMASQAEPLWSALQDSAFKRQLLTEIAQKVGLSVAALSDLWSLKAAAQRDRQQRSSYANPMPEYPDSMDEGREDYSFAHQGGDPSRLVGQRQKSQWKQGPGGRWLKQSVVVQAPMRKRPISRQDNALRLIMGNATLWDTLGQDAHDMLCALPHPHGTVFKWLDVQHHDKGPQPWSVLQLALQQEPWAQAIDVLMQDPSHFDTPENDLESELRDTLLRLELEHLGERAKTLAAQAERQPELLRSLAQLNQRLAAVKSQLNQMVRN
jgi:DNA primase